MHVVKAKKHLGQNFLCDEMVIEKIVKAISPGDAENIVEIGPGLGALTGPLVEAMSKPLTVIEYDKALARRLSQIYSQNELKIINSDVLEVNFSDFKQKLRVVGNLPYNISTPILLHCVQHIDAIEDLHFMLQKEVVDRMAAPPSTKAYGRLTVLLSHFFEIFPLFDVPPEAFTPQPKVDSTVVRLMPKANLQTDAAWLKKFQFIVQKSFAMRRKTLKNNLKGILSASELIELNITPADRAECLSVLDYVEMTNYLVKKR